MAVDSRQVKPANRAATEHPPNFPKKDVAQMAIVYPQMRPVLSRPRLVESPEIVKYYWQMDKISSHGELEKRTRGKKMITTASSSFSVMMMARFPSLGTMSPVTKAPMQEVQ